MKKLFAFFTAVVLAAVSMNAQTTVFSWADNVGKTEVVGTKINLSHDVKIQTNMITVKSIAFEASYSKDGDYNYLNIMPASGSFLKDDIVKVEYCYNNTTTKVATVGLYAAEDELLVETPQGINARLEDGISSFTYVLTKDLDTIRVARGASGNTRTCVTKLEVVRGEAIQEKALHPIFSIAGGVYYEPFNLSLSSAEEDAVIYYRLNGAGDFAVYADSIEISEYDQVTLVEAFATREGALNSDTVKASYTLEHFIARPVFNARATYEFAGITADDIKIQTPATATMGTYTMDGEQIPSVNYVNARHEDRDSFMLVSITGREDVLFRYKNNQKKNNIMKFANDFLQCDGSNFEIWIDNVHSGDTIVFVVTAKGSAPPTFDHTFSTACYLDPFMPNDDTDPCYTDGLVTTALDAMIENNYAGWQNLVYTVQEGHSRIRIKETNAGFRIAKILV